MASPILISDNNSFDAMFTAYYFHRFYGSNPFGWSSRRIGDIFCGAEKDMWFKWKKFRKTAHDHNPVNDAIGNAEAVLLLHERYKIKLPKSLFVVDWEADGPVPHLYSGVCFGCVKVDSKLDKTFYGTTAPISNEWIPDALAVSGFTREEHLKFDNPEHTMKEFADWIKGVQ